MRVLLKLTQIEMKLFLREPLTAVFTLLLPLIVLFILGGVFGNEPDPSGEIYRGIGAMDYYVPAYIGLVVASMGLIGLPVHLAGYREAGVLRRFRASSVGLPSLIGSQVLVTVVLGAVGSLLLIAAAFLAYDVNPPHAPLSVAAAFLLVALSFAGFGVLLGSLMPTARAAQGAGVLLWFVMLFLSGPGPPLEVLPRTMRLVGDATPLKHATLLLQDLWLGYGWNASELLIVLVVLVASLALSLRFFRWE